MEGWCAGLTLKLGVDVLTCRVAALEQSHVN